MDLRVTEKIGVYDIIYTNTIIVYKDQEIRLKNPNRNAQLCQQTAE